VPTTVDTIPLLNSVRACSKISGTELYRRTDDGRLAAVKVGAYMRVTRDALLNMISALPKVGG
jgi:hypothetical protein